MPAMEILGSVLEYRLFPGNTAGGFDGPVETDKSGG